MAVKTGVTDQQVRIGGKSYTLRFSVKALAALQEHWRLASFREVGDRLGGIGDAMGADDLVGILWAGLRTHHAEIDKTDVLDLIDAAGMDGLVTAISVAIAGSLPDGEEATGAAAANPPPRGRKKTGR